MSDTTDEVSLSFRFTKDTADELQRWIDMGYFRSHTDIVAQAFSVLRTAVTMLEQDKKVIEFNKVAVSLEVEVPDVEDTRVLN